MITQQATAGTPMTATGSIRGAARALALGTAIVTAPALAHPHIFIDTGLEIVFDDEGRLAAVQVVWVHDEFYSMMAIDDYGLDPEFTGTITDEGRRELAEIYSGWVEGYEGDLYPLLGGEALKLTGPLDVTADYREGRMIIVHRRAFEDRVDLAGAQMVFRVYDPTYYTAYTVAVDPVIRGRDDCVAEIHGPDLEAANARLMAALEEMEDADFDDWEAIGSFPEVGEEFAEEVRLICGSSF